MSCRMKSPLLFEKFRLGDKRYKLTWQVEPKWRGGGGRHLTEIGWREQGGACHTLETAGNFSNEMFCPHQRLSPGCDQSKFVLNELYKRQQWGSG